MDSNGDNQIPQKELDGQVAEAIQEAQPNGNQKEIIQPQS